MAHLIVAIDPGVNGGIVWSYDGAVQTAKMPASDVEVCQLLADLSCKAKDVSLYLEEPPLFAGKNIPGSAIGKLMWNTGVLYGAAVAMGWKIHRVKPQAWQAAHSLGKKKDHGKGWKNHLKGRALELYGNRLDITLWNADAVLLYDAAQRGVIN